MISGWYARRRIRRDRSKASRARCPAESRRVSRVIPERGGAGDELCKRAERQLASDVARRLPRHPDIQLLESSQRDGMGKDFVVEIIRQIEAVAGDVGWNVAAVERAEHPDVQATFLQNPPDRRQRRVDVAQHLAQVQNLVALVGDSPVQGRSADPGVQCQAVVRHRDVLRACGEQA